VSHRGELGLHEGIDRSLRAQEACSLLASLIASPSAYTNSISSIPIKERKVRMYGVWVSFGVPA